MTWFRSLTGIEEHNPDQVRAELAVEGDMLVCPNGRRIAYGRLETPTLAELRARVASATTPAGSLRVREVVGDVRKLHADESNSHALFQVASQFNLLEMTGPSVTPEQGVGIYEQDHTQGPSCAISCGAGTIYRNYFANVDAQLGQSADRQIDCAADLGELLGNQDGHLWKMRNGYLFPTDAGLDQITAKLRSADDIELDRYRASLRVGLQWDVDVTIAGTQHRVSQAYCSALPVAYGSQPANCWNEFARLVLEAAYEATICAAILNHVAYGSKAIYLTLLGGGVFGNYDDWIIGAIERAIELHRNQDLDVAIVSYAAPKPAVTKIVAKWRRAANSN